MILDRMPDDSKKYRDLSRRMPDWDYSNSGKYFMTFVTAERVQYFGEIVSGQMILNPFGKIALHHWEKSFEIRNELSCDEFIIMPNHIHAILVIDHSNPLLGSHGSVGTHGPIVGTDGRPSLQLENPNPNFGIAERKPKSISSFLAGYKSAVLNAIDDYIDQNEVEHPKFNRNNPLWQPNYHDRIIRNQSEYLKLSLIHI